jgi:Flp pilus assembly protein TadD
VSEAYDLFQRGKTLLRDGMAAQATVALEKARRLEPEKASIREALGIAYYRLTRWEAAEAEFRKVLELSPVDDYAYFALGRSLEKQGREQEARRYLEVARFFRRRQERELGEDQSDSRSETSDE